MSQESPLLSNSGTDVVVCIDEALKDSDRFAALLENRDLFATSIDVGSIDSHHTQLLQLFEANRAIRSTKISGRWTVEHLRFCESLLAQRPDVDIRFDIVFQIDRDVMIRAVEFCKLNRCSSVSLTVSVRQIPTCMVLASALQSMSSLQELSLRGNTICAEGCRMLAPALQSMSSLQRLDLYRNEIGDAGCLALAPALQSMLWLQTLDLSSNQIGVEGCHTLASALKSMSSLQKFDLSVNPIGDEGCMALVVWLQSMSSLQKLNLCENVISGKGCRALAIALKSMSSLKCVLLYENPIDEDERTGLKSSLPSLDLQF